MTETTGLIVLPSGEAIALTAEPAELAQAVDRVAEMRGVLNDIDADLSAELVRRLDKRGQWTLRVGDPADGFQWEIKSSSPTAGTTGWDEGVLAGELDALVDAGVIDRSLAVECLERKVTVVFKVDSDAAVAELLKTAKADTRVASVNDSRAAAAGALKRIEKIPGTADALARARTAVAAPTRRAKVKRVEKAKR